MGVQQIKARLFPSLPTLVDVTMRYDNAGRKEVYSLTTTGGAITVTVDPQKTEDAIVAAILDGVKKQEASNDGTTEPLHG